MKNLNFFISLIFLISCFGFVNFFPDENYNSFNNSTTQDSIEIISKYPADSQSDFCTDTIYTVRFKFNDGNDTLVIKKNILVDCSVSSDTILQSGYRLWIVQFINQ